MLLLLGRVFLVDFFLFVGLRCFFNFFVGVFEGVLKLKSVSGSTTSNMF